MSLAMKHFKCDLSVQTLFGTTERIQRFRHARLLQLETLNALVLTARAGGVRAVARCEFADVPFSGSAGAHYCTSRDKLGGEYSDALVSCVYRLRIQTHLDLVHSGLLYLMQVQNKCNYLLIEVGEARTGLYYIINYILFFFSSMQ